MTIFQAEKNRNLKIKRRHEIHNISISLHAKFQGNRTISLGKKREYTDTHTDTQTETQIHLNFINKD